MAVLAKVSYSIYSIAHADDIGDWGRERNRHSAGWEYIEVIQENNQNNMKEARSFLS